MPFLEHSATLQASSKERRTTGRGRSRQLPTPPWLTARSACSASSPEPRARYAAAHQECLDGLQRGLDSVLFAATGLRQAADHYESVDAAYYEQFGYIGSRQ